MASIPACWRQTVDKRLEIKGDWRERSTADAPSSTDGEPGDYDWHQTFVSTLTYDRQTGIGMKAHPIIIPFGFRDASEHILRKLAYPLERAKWYHSKSHDIEMALGGILGLIMNTVISSGRSASTGQPTLVQQAPDRGSGIAYGDPDEWL